MFPIIGAIAGGVAGLAQVGMGIADRIKGKRKLKEAESFYEQRKFKIPPAAKAALGVAERQAQGVRLPGEDIRRAQMQQATATGVGAAQQAATSSSDVLSVLGGLYGQQQMGEQQLGLAGAERFDRNQAMLQSELGRMANLEREKWQYNTLYPYQQMLGQAEAYQTRGAGGIGAGLGTIGETAGGFMQQQSAEAQYNQFLQQMGLGSQPTQQTQIPRQTQYSPQYRDINQQQKPYY